jgi:hypothetical protein
MRILQLASSGLQPGSVTSDPGEKGLQVFAGFFVQPPGTGYTVTLTYELPASLQPSDYALVLQRQAGTPPLPAKLRAELVTRSFVLHDDQFDWRPESEDNLRTR